MFRSGIGVGCTLILILFIVGVRQSGAQPFGMGTPTPTVQPTNRVLGCGGGRYVFGQISDSGKDQFMLDTLTGRLWQIAESGEIGLYLRPVPYRAAEGRYDPLPPDAPAPEKGEPGPRAQGRPETP